MFRIGLTGGIGSGKTTVARILEAMGFPVFYSDEVAKEILDYDSEVRSKLTALIGKDLYLDDKIDRAKLADAIFQDPDMRAKVNMIIHPKVREAFADFYENNRDKKLVFNEAAILFETGIYKSFDKNILVTAPEELRIQRVSKRDGVSHEKVRERMKAQWPDREKEKLADFVIVNDNDSAVLSQVEDIVGQLISS